MPVNATSSSVFLRLQPGFDGQSPITGYKLEYAKINDSYWFRVHVNILTVIKVGQKGYELTKLEPHEGYEFRARAVNKFGRSDFSEATDPYWTLPKPPIAPKSVKVKGKATTIEMSWKAPPFGPGMGTILGYVVLHRRVGNRQYTEDRVDGGRLDFVIEDLSKGTMYEVGVATLSQYGRTKDGKIKYLTVNTIATGLSVEDASYVDV